MSIEEINKKLKELKGEDIIWYIYIGIIIASLYSNKLEREYFLTGNKIKKEDYRKITITIFIILLIGYIYFLNNAYQEVKNLNQKESTKKRNLTYLSFIASLLITISGIIFLYIAIVDENLDVEIAFNWQRWFYMIPNVSPKLFTLRAIIVGYILIYGVTPNKDKKTKPSKRYKN